MKKTNIDESSAERKGKIYECFVGLAFEHAFGSFPETEGSLPGVIADQDTIWPTLESPQIVASVTHWGSHEAANKKFWRIHEDFYEIKNAYPAVSFFSIVFERNEGSDENLCNLLDHLTAGKGISDLNCNSIKILQSYVRTAKNQDSFGSTLDTRKKKTSTIFSSDSVFQSAILDLAHVLKTKRIHSKRSVTDNAIIKKGSDNLQINFRIPADKETFFKPALIALLDIGDALDAVFNAMDSFKTLPTDLASKLVSNGCLAEDPDDLTGALVATPIMLQLFEQGRAWCNEMLINLRMLVSDSSHALYSYHDHLLDIVETESCSKRIKLLAKTNSQDALVELITNWEVGMNRCWPIDYTTAIQRSITKGGKFGIQRLSELAGIPYRGAPVSCPLPCYASGDKSRLSGTQIRSLAKAILSLLDQWPEYILRSTTIQRDRRITLMKKLSVVDACIEVGLRKYIPKEYIKGSQMVRHPFSSQVDNVLAGSTEFNLKITNGTRKVFLFVAAAYEASHKHKELSGRLRGARGAGCVTENDLALMVIDGNLLCGSSRLARVQMFSAAGWGGAFLVDEMKELASAIMEFLANGTRSKPMLEASDAPNVTRNIQISERNDLPLAAEQNEDSPKLKRKGGHA